MALDNEVNLLVEIVDGCKQTGKFATVAVDIFCKEKRAYRYMEKLYDVNGTTALDYAMSCVRDYIWFDDKE